MKQLLSARQAAEVAVKALDNKKAMNLMLLEVKGLTTLTEYMLLATGTSDTHLRALCDEVEKKMEVCGVMVHVFTQEQRKFYDLERLWGDAPMVDLTEILGPQA